MASWFGAAWVSLAVALAGPAGGPEAIVVDLAGLQPMSTTRRQAMTSEAAALWKPHGAIFIWIDTAGPDSPLPHDALRVIDDRFDVEGAAPARADAGRSQSQARPLGAVVFLGGRETPERTIVLSTDAIVRTVDLVRWRDRLLTDLPADMRERVVGRALGRVLAHEIGHYLLASRLHAPDGLMRAAFRADQLAGLSRREFAMSEPLASRLRVRLAERRADRIARR